jgi:hypothetical protein
VTHREEADHERVFVSEFLTLDGVMQDPGGSDEDREEGFQHGGWQMPYPDAVVTDSPVEKRVDGEEEILGELLDWPAHLVGSHSCGVLIWPSRVTTACSMIFRTVTAP